MTTTAPAAVQVAPRRFVAPRLRTDRAMVAGLAALALLLRLPNVGRAYWIDEALTIGISSHPLASIPGLLRHDGSPPLFYVLLHFWLELFGSSPIATHSLPLLISVLTVPAGYWAGRELFGRPAALATAALMATNPFLAWYSTETRMYTLVVLLATVGTTLAWRANRYGRRRDTVGAVITGAALLYTHAWCMYLVAAAAALLMWHAVRRQDKSRLKKVALAAAATVALWLPWVPSFAAQADNSAAPWAGEPGIGDFFADPATIIGGTLGALVVPLLVIGAVLTWYRRRRSPEESLLFSGPAPYIAAIALLTTVIGFAGALVEPSWTVRYLSVIAAPYLVATGGYLATNRSGRRTLWVVCVLLTVWSVAGSLLPNSNASYAKDNMAAVGQATSPLLAPGDVVIVTETEQVPVAHFYLPTGLTFMNPTGPVADPTYVDWTHIVERLNAATPCGALAATLNAMPVGSRVLEIDPLKKLGVTGSEWSKIVSRQIGQVDSFLAADPALQRVGIYAPGLNPRPFSPVYGVLWEKTSPALVCT